MNLTERRLNDTFHKMLKESPSEQQRLSDLRDVKKRGEKLKEKFKQNELHRDEMKQKIGNENKELRHKINELQKQVDFYAKQLEEINKKLENKSE